MKIAPLMTASVLLLGLLPGCQDAKKAAPAGAAGAEKLYDLRGTVVAVDVEKKTVTLDHEDIPGLMRAMKMSFPVADAKTLEGLKEGDKVEGKLRAGDGGNVVTELRKRSP